MARKGKGLGEVTKDVACPEAGNVVAGASPSAVVVVILMAAGRRMVLADL